MIVKEHLIKKQLDAHSLKPEQMIISDDIIMESFNIIHVKQVFVNLKDILLNYVVKLF